MKSNHHIWFSLCEHSTGVYCLLLLLHTGDNILTAVSVAKSCGMVGADEKVIFVTATPHTANSLPTIKFTPGEETSSSPLISTQISNGVCVFAKLIFFSINICQHMSFWEFLWLLFLFCLLFLNQHQHDHIYHFALNGKSFAALCDYFPNYLPKVT